MDEEQKGPNPWSPRQSRATVNPFPSHDRPHDCTRGITPEFARTRRIVFRPCLIRPMPPLQATALACAYYSLLSSACMPLLPHAPLGLVAARRDPQLLFGRLRHSAGALQSSRPDSESRVDLLGLVQVTSSAVPGSVHSGLLGGKREAGHFQCLISPSAGEAAGFHSVPGSRGTGTHCASSLSRRARRARSPARATCPTAP